MKLESELLLNKDKSPKRYESSTDDLVYAGDDAVSEDLQARETEVAGVKREREEEATSGQGGLPTSTQSLLSLPKSHFCRPLKSVYAVRLKGQLRELQLCLTHTVYRE